MCMTIDVKIIEGRQKNKLNAQIKFMESVNGVLRKGRKKTKIYPRDKSKAINPTT